ncbi:MAG: flagellar basal body-associated FliL family protein [Oscillospiraceae bacterium]|nr:flagellar basal body-associated FliL family protein [Oscillospiraceae bacterium]
MKKMNSVKSLIMVAAVLFTSVFLSACGDEPVSRLPYKHLFNPGAAFATNINHDDPRRVLRCSMMFEVIDEAAVEELTNYTAAIRNAVLMVLGELTMAEVTTDKDLEDIAARVLERVNDILSTNIPLVIGAYFTEFVLT